MIRVTARGSYSKTKAWLHSLQAPPASRFKSLERYGPIGVAALAKATPKESGETATSWGYEIESKPGRFAIHWTNTHMAGEVPVAVLLQYGHATGNGGYVRGRDYINPAMQPIFDQIAQDMWKEVSQ